MNWKQQDPNSSFDDTLEEIFQDTDKPELDNIDDALETPQLMINLDDVNTEAKNMAALITERLSNYYFDEQYIKDHPYIPTKIMTEMNNIRRLIKMLSINEKAQDALITSISINAGKGTLYQSLTSLQSAMLHIQTQLDTLTSNLENVFREMQEECEKTFADKDKEANDDGSMVVRGSRDFIKQLNARLMASANTAKEEPSGVIDGEVIDETNIVG